MKRVKLSEIPFRNTFSMYSYLEDKKNEIVKNMIDWRTIRNYMPEQITKEELDTILLAGSYAPSAGGRQSSIKVVCQNAALNDELEKINVKILIAIFNERPPMDLKSDAQEKLPDNFAERSKFNGAPIVITLFAPKDWYNFIA